MSEIEDNFQIEKNSNEVIAKKKLVFVDKD